MSACTATHCYVCDGTDSSCNDEYYKPASHETDCNSLVLGELLNVYTEDGGCSKLKLRQNVGGVSYVAGQIMQSTEIKFVCLTQVMSRPTCE